MLLAFFPMLGVAVGFYWLNRRIPDCGTSYAWIARSLHPALGFFTGWVIIIADVIVMISLAGVAASATLTLFGQDAGEQDLDPDSGRLLDRRYDLDRRARHPPFGASPVGHAGSGIRHRTAFCIWAIVQVYTESPRRLACISLNWLLPWQTPGGSTAVLAGLLAAVFIYWGWDTAANVNEETENATVAPGLATVYATFALLVIYVFAAFAIVSYVPASNASINDADVLTTMAQNLAGGNKIWYLMVLAVLSSAAASTQTTILPTARVTFSMARDRIIPAVFARVHHQYLTPWVSSVVMGAVSIVAFVISLYASGGIASADPGRHPGHRSADRVLLRPHRHRRHLVLPPLAVPEPGQLHLRRYLPAGRRPGFLLHLL